MKIHRLITLLSIVTMALYSMSCEDEEPTKTTDVIEEVEDTTTKLPEGYIVFEADTFYIVSAARLNDPNAHRFQMNLATAADIGIASNDGNPKSTCILILSSAVAPTASGSYTLLAEQGGFKEGEANLKLGFFSNTDHKYKGQEFLSTGGESFDYTWDSKYEITLSEIEMTNYFDDTIVIDLDGVVTY